MITLQTTIPVTHHDMSTSPAVGGTISTVVEMTIYDYMLRNRNNINEFVAKYEYTYTDSGTEYKLQTFNNGVFKIPDATQASTEVEDMSTVLTATLPTPSNIVEFLRNHVIAVAKSEMSTLFGITTAEITVI